jgi:SNF family Na+-dependent transporter
VGAGGTGIINIMAQHMGRGWCFTFLALVCIAAMPMLLVELRMGPVWREERRVRMEKEVAEEKRKERWGGVIGRMFRIDQWRTWDVKRSSGRLG